jgi:hypothetical protein
VPGYYLPPNRHPTSPGDYEALSRYAGRLRAAAKKFQAISDDADAWVCFYADGWQGPWKDSLFATWCQLITANDAMNANSWAADRANFVHDHPNLARLYDANSQPGQTIFRQTIDSLNSMANWLDGCSQQIRQEEAQAEAFFLDALIVIVAIGVSAVSLGSLSAPAMILAGALIGGVTAGAIDATNQGIYNQYGLQNGFNWGELGLSALTGFVVGGLSALAGMGLGFVLVRALPVSGLTTFIANSLTNTKGLVQLGVRIAINSTGFGVGTFASEMGMQAFDHWVDPSVFKTGVDPGQAAQDALFSAGLGAMFEGVHAATHPDTMHWSFDTPGGHYDMVAQPDGTKLVFGPDPGGGGGKGPLLGTGELKWTALVQEDGSATRVISLEITRPDGSQVLEPMVNSQARFGTIADGGAIVAFDDHGSPSLLKAWGVSDGTARFGTADGTVTVPKGWHVDVEPLNGKMAMWDPARPNRVSEFGLVNGGFTTDGSALGPQIAGGGQAPTLRETPQLTTGEMTPPASPAREVTVDGTAVVGTIAGGDIAAPDDRAQVVLTSYSPDAPQGDPLPASEEHADGFTPAGAPPGQDPPAVSHQTARPMDVGSGAGHDPASVQAAASADPQSAGDPGQKLLPPGPGGSVDPRALSPEEAAQAQRIWDLRQGSIEGPAVRSEAGIDGTRDGRFISLKTTQAGLRGFAREIGRAETQAQNAGYRGVDVYVEAPNIASATLLDFGRRGVVPRIIDNGVVGSIWVLTRDGWVVFPGRPDVPPAAGPGGGGTAVPEPPDPAPAPPVEARQRWSGPSGEGPVEGQSGLPGASVAVPPAKSATDLSEMLAPLVPEQPEDPLMSGLERGLRTLHHLATGRAVEQRSMPGPDVTVPDAEVLPSGSFGQPPALVAANPPHATAGQGAPHPAVARSDWMPASWGIADLPVHRGQDGAVHVVGKLPAGHYVAVYALFDRETGQFLKWGLTFDPLGRYGHDYRMPRPGEASWSDRLPAEVAGRPVVARLVATDLPREQGTALEKTLREHWGGPANVESDYKDQLPSRRTDLQAELTGSDFGTWLTVQGGLGVDPRVVSEFRPDEPALPGTPRGRPTYPATARPLFDAQGRPLVDASQVPVEPLPQRGAVTRPLPPLDPSLPVTPPNRFWEHTQLPVHRDATGAVRVVGVLPRPGNFVVYALFDRATGQFLKWGRTDDHPMSRYGNDPVVMRIVLTDLPRATAVQVEGVLNERWGGPKNLERVYMDNQPYARELLQRELAGQTFATWLAGHPELGIDLSLLQDFGPGQPALPGTPDGRPLYPRSSSPLFESAAVSDPHADPFPAQPERAPAEPLTVTGIDPASVLNPESPEFERLWKALWHLQVDSGLEHAVVQTADGRFMIVYGGKYEILDNPALQIRAVYLHVHPFWLPADGPSPQDIRFLALTPGQQQDAFLLQAGAPPLKYSVPPELRQALAAGGSPEGGMVEGPRASVPAAHRVAGPPAAPGRDQVLDAFQKPGRGSLELSLRQTQSLRRIPTPSGDSAHIPWLVRAPAALFGVHEPQLLAMLGNYFHTVDKLPQPLRRLIDWPRAMLMSPGRGTLSGSSWNSSSDVAMGVYSTPDGSVYLGFGHKNFVRSVTVGPTTTQRPGIGVTLAQNVAVQPPLDIPIPLAPGITLHRGALRASMPVYGITGETRRTVMDGRVRLTAVKLWGPGPRIVHARIEGVPVTTVSSSTGVGVAPLVGWSYNLSVHGVLVPLPLYGYIKPVAVGTVNFPHDGGASDLPRNLRALVDPGVRTGPVTFDAEARLPEVAIGLFFTPNPVRLFRFYIPELNALDLVAPGALDAAEHAIDRVPWLNWNFNPEWAPLVLGRNFPDVFRHFRKPVPAPRPAPGTPDRVAPSVPPGPGDAGSAAAQPALPQRLGTRPAAGVRPKPRYPLRTGVLPRSGVGRRPGALRTTPLPSAGRPPLRRPAPSPIDVASELRDGLMTLDALQTDPGPGGRPSQVTQAASDLSAALKELNAAADALLAASRQGLTGSELTGLHQAAGAALARMGELLPGTQALARQEQYVRERLRLAVLEASRLPAGSRPPELETALTRLEGAPLSRVVASTMEAVEATMALIHLLATDPELP